MDKAPEINSSPENPKIPENWQFPERNESHALTVIHVDKDEGYLALDMSSSFKRTRDYLFNRNGLPLLKRIVAPSLSDIAILKWGEVETKYRFNYGPRPFMYVGFSSDLEDLDWQSNDIREIREYWFYCNDVLFTDRGSIDRVTLQSPKLNGPEPDIKFSNIHGKEARYGLIGLHGLNIMDQGRPNKLVFVNNQGEKEYVVEWNITTREDELKNKIPFFIVRQSHLENDVVMEEKIIESPIQIDMDTVRSALLSKPPYPKDERGKLVVPWRNIDRIVGASLSYSSPPPKQS